MLQSNPKTLAGTQFGVANKQRSRLRIALALLLVAFVAVLVRDREFWFGSDEALAPEAATSESAQTAGSAAVAKTIQAPIAQVPTAQAPIAQTPLAAKTSVGSAVAVHKDANPSLPVVAAKRSAVPSLKVEVVANGTHRAAHPASNVAKVEMPSAPKLVPAVTTSVVSLPTNAAEREPLTPESVPVLRQTVDATYPLLGPRMKVQGSVVLQAVIGADGAIENLRVLSGPAVLSAAAQQAVRQWRFKPYLENGSAVETKATITVNFSIQISDNPAKTS